MAGDWIKFECQTSDKPEVWQMAEVLKCDADLIVGKLLRIWSWFDAHTESGKLAEPNDQDKDADNRSCNGDSVTKKQNCNVPSVTKLLLDRKVGMSGFCDVMISVGWMVERDGQISLPNFDRHNGKTAKTRAMTGRRVASHRLIKASGNGQSVTKVTQGALAREEKRREEKKEKKQISLDAPIGTYLGHDAFLAIWGKWRNHLSERFKQLTPTSEEAQLFKLSHFPVDEAIAIVEFSIAAGAINLILNGDHKRKASPANKASSFDEVF
jgi:hypothetical protein